MLEQVSGEGTANGKENDNSTLVAQARAKAIEAVVAKVKSER